MKTFKTHLASFALLTILLFTACDSASETNKPEAKAPEKNYDKLLTKDELAASAIELQEKLVEIVKDVTDPDSAKKANEECKKLQPLADQIMKSGNALKKEMGPRKLAEYLRANGTDGVNLSPMTPVLGEKSDSKYPELHQTVVDLLEGSIHSLT